MAVVAEVEVEAAVESLTTDRLVVSPLRVLRSKHITTPEAAVEAEAEQARVLLVAVEAVLLTAVAQKLEQAQVLQELQPRKGLVPPEAARRTTRQAADLVVVLPQDTVAQVEQVVAGDQPDLQAGLSLTVVELLEQQGCR